MGIPIVAVVDTNGDPDEIDYPIPGNDDAVRAIELFTSKVSEAILDGRKNRMEKDLLDEKAAQDDAAVEGQEDMKFVPDMELQADKPE